MPAPRVSARTARCRRIAGRTRGARLLLRGLSHTGEIEAHPSLSIAVRPDTLERVVVVGAVLPEVEAQIEEWPRERPPAARRALSVFKESNLTR